MAFKALDVNGNDIPNAKKRTSKDIFTLEEQIKKKTSELEEEGKYLSSAAQQLQKYGADANDFALLAEMAENEKDFNDSKSRYETAKKGYDSIVDEYTKRQRDYTNKFQGLQYDLRDYEDVMKNMTASEWDKVAEHEDQRITGSYSSPFANALWDKPSYEEFADREQMVATAQQNAAYARRMADEKRDEEWQNAFNSKHFETLPNFAVDSMYDHKYDDDDFYYMVNNPEMYGTSNTDSNRGGGKSFSGTDKDDWFTRIFGPDYVYNRETLTDNEKALFNYIYKTQGRDKAMEFFDTIPEEVLNFRSARREAENNEAFGYENPLMANIKSVASNLFKPVTYAASLLDIGKDGKYTRNAWYNVPTIDTEGLTKGVVQKINDVTDDIIHQQIADELMEKYGSVSQEMIAKVDENINYGFIHNAENFGYQTLLSMENFLVNTGVANVIGGSAGLSQAATNWLDLGMMGSGAALDATKKSLDRGMTDGQSFLLGVIAGLAEVATEKVSIEALFSPKTGIKYVLDNFIAEGSEEVASDLINWAADVTIGQGASEWADSVREHNGDIGAALQEKLLDSALSFLGGAISGGIMGGVSQGFADIRAEKFGKMIKDMGTDGIEYIQSLIEDGKKSSNKQIKKIAEALDSQLKENGIDIENLDNKSIGRLNQLFLIEEENVEPVAEEPVEAEEAVIEDGIPQTFAAPLTDEEAIARLKEEGIDMNNVGNLTRTILPKETNNDIRGSERSIAENDGRTSEQSSEWGTQTERAARRRSLPNSGESKTASSVFRIQKAEGEISYISNKTAKSDPELAEILSKAKTDGAKVKFYRGTTKVGNKLIFGNFDEKTGVIHVQIDSDTRTAMATYEHEKVHLKSVQNKSLVSDFLDSIRNTEEFSAVMDAYKQTYNFQRGDMTESEFELWVAEEILADAEAGLDKGGAATAYAEIAHQILDVETTESETVETVETVETETIEEPKTRGPPQTFQETAQAQLDKSAPKTETKPAPKAETVQKSAQKQIDRKTETKKTEKPKGFAIDKTLLNGFESFIKEHNNGKYEINGVKLAQPRTLFSDPDAIIEVFNAIVKYENSEMMGTLLADRYEQISGETFPVDGFEQLQDEYGENEAYAAPLANATADESGNETHFSVESSIRGAGIEYSVNDDGSVSFNVGLQNIDASRITGKQLSTIDSPLKLVMDNALASKTMTQSQVNEIYNGYAEYLRMASKYLGQENGIAMLDSIWKWKIANDTFKSVKSNSDPQYSTSIDILTICKKTAQLMHTVSAMQQKLQHGLTPSEMFECYLKTGEAGFQTPCPICYVFSHWIDNGKYLNTIWNAQSKYAQHFDGGSDVWTAKQWLKEYNKQKKIAEDYSKAIKTAKEIIAESMLVTDVLAAEYDKSDASGKKKIKELIAKQSKAYSSAVRLLSEMDYAAWIKQNAISIDKNGNAELRNDYNEIEPDILFDMYRTSEVVEKYPNVARFKSSKGNDAGKQVETASNNEFGSVIEGIAQHGERKEISDILKNYNTASESEKEKIRADFKKIFDNAVKEAKRQSLVGGQRIFSWSDNRIEFGPDMYMNLLQLQAIGSSVQSYTKQLEGLELIAAMGGYCNASLIGEGKGYDSNGNLVFSKIMGIDPEKTFELNRQYDKAGNILVGMNAKHIRIAIGDKRIFFVIPYHASGLRSSFLAKMMAMLGVDSSYLTSTTYDATPYQGEGFGDSYTMNGKTRNVTQEQMTYRSAREKIIMNGMIGDLQLASLLTKEELSLLNNDEYLKNIRNKTRGIKMRTSDTQSIFPYEYWNESSTYETADINRERYLEFCEKLGVQPKFSGIDKKGNYNNDYDYTKDAGYWKLLVDRRMYDRNGKYQGTTAVEANNFTTDLIDPAKINEKYDVTRYENAKEASRIADNAISEMRERGLETDISITPSEKSQAKAINDFAKATRDTFFKTEDDVKKYLATESADSEQTRTSAEDERYLELAKDPKKNEAELTRLVEEAALDKGYTKQNYITGSSKYTKQAYRNIRSESLDIASPKERFDFVYEECRKIGPQVTQDDFFQNTIAKFTERSRRPSVEPNYVSRNKNGEVSSEYWYTSEGVVRGSKHWGNGIRTCDWALDTVPIRQHDVTLTNKKYGFCKWSDFAFKDAPSKSIDSVTYDDEGNVIPLSKRFDDTVADTRFSAEEESKANQLISDYGIKIAKPIVADYSKYETLMENDRAARDVARRIKAVDKIFPLSSTEKTIARRLASDKIDEEFVKRNYPGAFNIEAKKDAILQLAELYREQDKYADDTIDKERSYTNVAAENHAAEWFALDGDENLKALKNIKMMNSNTPKRMCRSIWGSERGENIYNEFFRPVGKNEANRMRWVNKMYDRVKSIGKLTTEESAVVQKMLEGIDLDGNEKFRKDRVDKAVETLRQTYSDMYDIINAFLVTHGIKPIGFIKDYAPHAQPESVARGLDSALAKAGVYTNELPTSISGRTSTFKPRHKFVRNFLTRTGDQTIYDAVNGYQDYINSVSEVIFHTDDIIRTRGIVNHLRNTYSPQNQQDIISTVKEIIRSKNLDEKVEYIVAHNLNDGPVDSMSEANKLLNEYIAKAFETKEESDSNTAFSEFVKWADNYANIIAGKQNWADRGLEYQKGRKSLNVGNRLVNLFRMANVSGNVSSVLNQAAQLPMIISELGFRNTVSVVKSLFNGDIRMTRQNSDFLVGKSGIDFITNTVGEMIVSSSFIGAEFVDSMISTIAVQGKLNEQIRKGKDYDDAMEIADEFARDIMGSRLKGEKPLRFTEKNIVSSIINMYQIEAANTWNHVVKDIPDDFKQIKRDKGVAAAVASLIGVIAKTLITSFALNRLDDELYGGSPAPYDLIGLTTNFIASGKELTTNDYIRTMFDDVSESFGGDRIFDTEKLDDQFNMVNAVSNTIFNVSNDLPYVRNVAGALGLGDQTIGLPMVAQGNQILSAIESGKWDEIPENLLEALPSLVPFGRQLSKTTKGLNEYFQGGAYTASGRLKYPVEQNIPALFQNALFGPYANKDAARYYAQGNPQAVSETKTTIYQDLLEAGYSQKEAYETAKQTSMDKKQKEKAEDAGLDIEQALTLTEKLDALRELYRDEETNGVHVPPAEKMQAIFDLGMSDEDTINAFSMFSDVKGYQPKAKICTEYDVDLQTFIGFCGSNHNTDGTGGVSQEDLTEEISKMDLTKSQKAALWQTYNKGWKGHKNPFDARIGELIYAEMHPEE